MNRFAGIILIVVGVAMLIWTGFTYTKKEKVIDTGPIQVSASKEHTINWPPYAGGLLVAGGIILLLASKKKAIICVSVRCKPGLMAYRPYMANKLYGVAPHP